MAARTTAGLPSAVPGALPRVTYEQFLAASRLGERLEWVDGEVIEMSPVSEEHCDLSMFLAALLRIFVETLNLGRVLGDPFQMKTGPDLPGRAPDLLYVASDHLDRIKPLYLDGPADLIVEIISPESRGRDRGEKYFEYEQGGVSEYWLIDPRRKQAEFYQRDADGIYRLVAPDADGIYRSRELPGLWLQVEWLWRRPLPSVSAVLREWGLLS